MHLLFVYNADSGLFGTLADIGHKILAPHTYPCRLCALTHGYFAMRRDWAAFIEELGIPCEFLHRDEFVRRYHGSDVPLPAVFRLDGDRPSPCLDAHALNACATVEALMRLIRTRCLAQTGP